MTDTHQTDETDLLLLHALQIAPRASWMQLTDVLGISAATAARRWTRRRLDLGYTTSWHAGGALVEVDCDAPHRGSSRELRLCVTSSERYVVSS